MILSFHPIIAADRNIICAGREPGEDDLAAIAQAEAVILPQGCSAALYNMARLNCAHVFPNLDVRFEFSGKCGQMDLFDQMGLDHPATECFASVAAFYDSPWQPAYPSVVKLDWGGQGETVFKLANASELANALRRVQAFESSGQSGFMIQEYIPCGRRALRVAVIGSHLSSYWRVQPAMDRFGTSLAQGAAIDHQADPGLQQAARQAVGRFCDKSGLQLAGFDFIFDRRDLNAGRRRPLALEINYFFGRDGLGGSQGYYQILETQVDAWLSGLALRR